MTLENQFRENIKKFSEDPRRIPLSSLTCFSRAVKDEKFSRVTIAKWFLELVDKDDYEGSKQIEIIDSLEDLSSSIAEISYRSIQEHLKLSSFECFKIAITDQGFSKGTIERWFYVRVDKSEYEEGQEEAIIADLYRFTSLGKNSEFRGKNRSEALPNQSTGGVLPLAPKDL